MCGAKVLVLEHNGAKPFSKASHTNRRFFKVRQLVNMQRVKLEWKGTLETRADPHTKITPGKELTRQMESYMKSTKKTANNMKQYPYECPKAEFGSLFFFYKGSAGHSVTYPFLNENCVVLIFRRVCRG